MKHQTAFVHRSRKALALALALLLLALLAPVHTALAGSEAEVPAKDPVKNGAGAPHGSAYHLPAPFEDGKLPEQRPDIIPGSIECMEDARSAVLIEAYSGQKLLSLNPDEELPMASTTKIMTALVVLENCSPDEEVTAMKEAVGVEGSSLYLSYGERLTVRDLLYALMLRSGNDCAVALAIHTAGSVEKFAEMMNERAARMGLVHTHFVTPNGLHDKEHYTSAYELTLIAAQALKNPVFREIVSSKYYTIDSSTRSITVKNKNSMLWDYEGCIGVKTGYTAAAGRCLVFAAERDGMMLVGCVLNCRPMFDVAPEMLDYGFENYCVARVLADGDDLGVCSVVNGTEDVIRVRSGAELFAPMHKGEIFNADVELEFSEGLTAPVFEGQMIGTAYVYSGGVLLGKAPVCAGSGSPERDYRYYLERLIELFNHS